MASPFAKLTTTDAIKKAYRKLALTCHPDLREDKVAAAEEFRTLTLVYENALANVGKQTNNDDWPPPYPEPTGWKGRARPEKKEKSKPKTPPPPTKPLVVDVTTTAIDYFEFDNFGGGPSRFISITAQMLFYGGTVNLMFAHGSGVTPGFRFTIPRDTKNGQVFRFQFPQGPLELMVVSQG